MKRTSLIALMFAAAASFATAQITTVNTDVLGAHLNYGRGCAACHAPHSGARGNGIATGDKTTGNLALWGEDLGPLMGVQIVTGQSEHGTYADTFPTAITTSNTVDVAGVMMCLSCHDGNYARGAMMQNKVYETLPSTYASQNVPTLLGADGNGNTLGSTAYLNDHPVGLNAIFSCNSGFVYSASGNTYGESGYNWDCGVTVSGTKFNVVPGPNMASFINNYGFFVNLGNNAGSPVVLCTTCHNQHVMNVVSVSKSSATAGTAVSTGLSGLPAGTYATMFFLRGPYNPASGTYGSNQTAQFCRQCHGGESNEMNGSSAVTTF